MSQAAENGNGGAKTPGEAGQDTRPTFSSVLGAGLGFILIAGPVLGFMFFIDESANASMSSGALQVLLVLSSTLAGLIIVTQALGLSQKGAALGLPKGSVRALLAFSLVVIFVAVASWNLGGFLETQVPISVKSLKVPTGEEQKALDAFQSQNIKAFVAEKGEEVTTVAYIVAPDPEAQKRATDMARDIMTVVATVLVTIVGFYFGSSSTIDGVNSAQTTMTSVKAALFNRNEGPEPEVPFAVADISRTTDATRAIADEMKSRFDGLGADPITPLKQAAEKDQQLKLLEDAEAAYKVMKKTSRAATAYADNAASIAQDITADSDQATLNAAGARVTQHQDDATKSKVAFDAEMTKFETARTAILGQSSQG